jgi:hypothetical protein
MSSGLLIALLFVPKTGIIIVYLPQRFQYKGERLKGNNSVFECTIHSIDC